MSGRKSRAKGARNELYVEKLLKTQWPDARRMGGTQARDPKYCDIEGTPFRVETKHHKSFTYRALLEFLEKLERERLDYEDYRPPLLIVRRDGQSDPLAIQPLSSFLGTVERFWWSPPDLSNVVPLIRMEDYKGVGDDDDAA